MNKYSFELEFIQLEELFSKSRSNKFSDSKKSKYFSALWDVFNAIKEVDYNSFETEDRLEHLQIFNYLFNGLEFLDTSTLNVIPFELVSCLELSLEEWVNKDDFIIMTSLSNRRSDIWFQGWHKERVTQIKELIYSKSLVGIKN